MSGFAASKAQRDDDPRYEYRWFLDGEPAGPGCFLEPITPPPGYELRRRPTRDPGDGWEPTNA